MMDELTMVQRIAVWVLPVVFAITVHETAHGWVAKKYGDNTAFMQGRLSLNPIKHIDWLGTIIIPGILLLTRTGFIFGWAKPVPVDVRNFKNPPHDMAIVALAGPVSNLLMALGWAFVARISFSTIGVGSENETPMIFDMCEVGISINLVLALVNLLPIPPLDGSRVLTFFLPPSLAWQYNQLERYGFIILLILLYTKILNTILAYPMYYAQNLFLSIAGLN